MMKIYSIYFLAITALLAGCAVQPKITNLTPLGYTIKPIVHTFVDPDAHFDVYKTFAIVPFSRLDSAACSMNPIEEREMMFYMRSLIERHGYCWVSSQDSADFVITINVNNPYEQTYIPQTTVQVPRWVPSQTITSNTSHDGFVSMYGSNDFANGNYSGQSTRVTTIPGYVTTTTETRGGYSIGKYYPQTSIYVYDRKTGRNVYQATGTACSYNSDARVACEQITAMCTNGIPNPKQDNSPCPAKSGAIGVICTIVTTDGNNYWPAVTNIYPNSPADNAGFQIGDFIMSIDSVSMRNKDISFAYCNLTGEIGAVRHILIWRLGERIPITVVFDDRAKVYHIK